MQQKIVSDTDKHDLHLQSSEIWIWRGIASHLWAAVPAGAIILWPLFSPGGSQFSFEITMYLLLTLLLHHAVVEVTRQLLEARTGKIPLWAAIIAKPLLLLHLSLCGVYSFFHGVVLLDTWPSFSWCHIQYVFLL